jgi:uncharacterized protein YjbI with pentapeptide repeats
LLQYTLTELWHRQQDNQLKLSTYHQLGGVTGTLQQTADRVYESLTPVQRQTAKHIFVSLTQLGEGAEDTRRRINQASLISPQHPENQVAEVVKRLADANLVVTDDRGRTSQGGYTATIDVVHEALIRYWPKLRQWLDENRILLRQKRRLETAAEEWKTHDYQTSYLLLGRFLKDALKVQKECSNDLILSSLENSFIQASIRQRRLNILKISGGLLLPALIVLGIIDSSLHQARVDADFAKLAGEGYEERKAVEDLVQGCGSQLPEVRFLSYLRERFIGSCYSLHLAPLTNANLSEATLAYADLRDANLQNANLRGVDAVSANLSDADLESANLSLADLRSAKLDYSNLKNVNFSDADLRGTSFRFADISNAVFSSFDLLIADTEEAEIRAPSLRAQEQRNHERQQVEREKFLQEERNKALVRAPEIERELQETEKLADEIRDRIEQLPPDSPTPHLSLSILRSAERKISNLRIEQSRIQSLVDRDNLTERFNPSMTFFKDARTQYLEDAQFERSTLEGTIFLGVDLRKVNGLDEQQLEGVNTLYVCNSPTPRKFEIPKNRDCELVAKVLLEKYPSWFENIDNASFFIEEVKKIQHEETPKIEDSFRFMGMR